MPIRSLSLLLTLILFCISASAQQSVSTNGKKYVLIEEMTGAWCSVCTDGIAELEWILTHCPYAIAAGIHDGDAMEIPESDSLRDKWLVGYPKATIDRIKYGSFPIGISARNQWHAITVDRYNKDSIPRFDITLQHSFSAATNSVGINVSAKALKNLTGMYRFNVYIVEDSVTGPATTPGWPYDYDQNNAYNNTAGHMFYGAGDPVLGYRHLHVVRRMLGGSWGTPGSISIDPSINTYYTKSYSYTFSGSINLQNVKIIAFVQKYNPSDSDDIEVLNAIQADLVTVPTAIKDAVALIGLSVSPNPAKDFIQLKGIVGSAGAINVSIRSMDGRQVLMERILTDDYGNFHETIQVSGLERGYYLMELSWNGNKTTRKISLM